jgi:hypothetical protein
MKDLIHFISRYEPLYAQVVCGYPEERIAELEAALGRCVPGAYRDFLATVAANVGFATGDANFDIDPVIVTVKELGPIPERFVPIGVDSGSTFYDYYLDLAYPSGDGDAMVIQLPDFEQPIPMYWSLRDMIFFMAFKEVRMLSLPERTQLLWLPSTFEHTKTPPSLHALGQVMTRLGFDALTVTRPEAQLYERGDAAASVYQIPSAQSFSLLIAARDRRTLLHVAETVRDALPGKPEVLESNA